MFEAGDLKFAAVVSTRSFGEASLAIKQLQKGKTVMTLRLNTNNSSKARINPKFPWLNYTKQLFQSAKSKTIFDPITFWYNHKRKFINNCWLIEDVEKLTRSWNLTLQIEKTKVLKPKQKTKLKYRGVSYYRH